MASFTLASHGTMVEAHLRFGRKNHVPTLLGRNRQADAFKSAVFRGHSQQMRHNITRTHAMLGGLANLFSSDPSEKTRKKYEDRVNAITALEPAMQKLSNEQLRSFTLEFRRRLGAGETVDDLLIEAFAVRYRVVTTVHGYIVDKKPSDLKCVQSVP
jgi:hypothetical protein